MIPNAPRLVWKRSDGYPFLVLKLFSDWALQDVEPSRLVLVRLGSNVEGHALPGGWLLFPPLAPYRSRAAELKMLSLPQSSCRGLRKKSDGCQELQAVPR
jgi:hypothetical protein